MMNNAMHCNVLILGSGILRKITVYGLMCEGCDASLNDGDKSADI